MQLSSRGNRTYSIPRVKPGEDGIFAVKVLLKVARQHCASSLDIPLDKVTLKQIADRLVIMSGKDIVINPGNIHNYANKQPGTSYDGVSWEFLRDLLSRYAEPIATNIAANNPEYNNLVDLGAVAEAGEFYDSVIKDWVNRIHHVVACFPSTVVSSPSSPEEIVEDAAETVAEVVVDEIPDAEFQVFRSESGKELIGYFEDDGTFVSASKEMLLRKVVSESLLPALDTYSLSLDDLRAFIKS